MVKRDEIIFGIRRWGCSVKEGHHVDKLRGVVKRVTIRVLKGVFMLTGELASAIRGYINIYLVGGLWVVMDVSHACSSHSLEKSIRIQGHITY